MICDYKQKFKTDFGKLIKSLENQSAEQIRSAALDYLKAAKQNAQDAGYSSINDFLSDWAKFVDWRLAKSGIEPIGSTTIQKILLGENEDISEQVVTTASIDIDYSKNQVNSDFLNQIYNGADEVKNSALRQINFNLCNSMIFNRDNGTVIRGDRELNKNLREYQQTLFDIVYNFLQKKGRTLPGRTLMYEDGKYTRAFEYLAPLAEDVFNKFDRKRLITEFSYQTDSLKAFNAYQTLAHFDEFLLHIFGDTIKIKDRDTKFTDSDKYTLSSKATAMFWANNEEDDIDLSKSINNLSRILVNSTRLYDYNSGTLIPDTYLNFGQFTVLVSKLKDLSSNRPLTMGILLNEVKARKRTIPLDSISSESADFIKSLGTSATLATLINKTRLYPREAFTAIFELLTSQDLKNIFKPIANQFTLEERNVLMSLGKELFNNQGNSLRRVQDLEGYFDCDYFSTLLQTSDTTCIVKNSQYSIDAVSGKMVLKSLLSSNINQIQRRLNDTLNTMNTPEGEVPYSPSYDKSGFNFTWKGKNVNIDNVGRVTIDKIPIENATIEQPVEFLDSVLFQNFTNNPKYLDNFVFITGLSRQQAIAQLFRFGAELLHGQFVLKKINDALSQPRRVDEEKLTKLERIQQIAKKYYPVDYYGEPKVSQAYSTIDIVPSKQLTTLEQLAEARAVTDGATSATSVKDSTGRTLATNSPSRLLSTYEMQMESIRDNPSCPAHNFSIVQDPYTFVNIYTVRELKTQDGEYKLFNQLSSREFLESAITYDLIQPLIGLETGKNNLSSKGILPIIPSVNSDKSTVSKLLVNLDHEVKKMGYSSIEEFISSTNNEPLLQYINKELGDYYSKLITKLNNDFKLFTNSPTYNRVFGDFVLEYTPESLQQFKDKARSEETFTSYRKLIDTISRESGVKINEELHFVFAKGGELFFNNSIIALARRYKNTNRLGFFLQYKNTELLTSLINSKVVIDLDTKTQNWFKKNELGQWISDSGTLIFAKYKDEQGNIHDIISEADFIQLGINKFDPHSLVETVVLNPLLSKYNALNYLYSQEFLLSTVGSHVNHPNKKANQIDFNNFEAIMNDEANRYQAQHKRNVSMTAAMHEYLLGQLTGVPTNARIAVTQDINDYVCNIQGDNTAVKPFDGSTFVNPFMVVLENNSLNGERSGIHKKPFIHFYDETTGTGGIIKTAGFGLTNSWLKNSPFNERMMKKMTDIVWSDQNGEPIYIDITRRYQGQQGEPDIDYGNIYYTSPIKNPNTGKWERQYNCITKIEYLGNGSYNLYETIAAKNGKLLGVPQLRRVDGIDTNYKVWKYIFQGINSVSLNENGQLAGYKNFGEQSIYNTVKAINSCGFLLKGNKPLDQNNFYQPMKHSDIHYLVTEGAIKQGAANYNTKSIYYDSIPFNSYSIQLAQAGIQLDKEHHADDSEISMMTQVVSACAALGYTWDESNKMYQALYSLTKQGIEPLVDSLRKELDPSGSNTEFSKTLANLLVKQLANGNKAKDGIIMDVVANLIDKYKRGEEITDDDIRKNPIPVSDPVLYNKIGSMLSSILTKSAIKLKFKGILSVLVPSHETIKLYGGKLKSEFVNFEEEIKELQAQQPVIGIQDVQMNRTYFVVDAEGNTIDKVHVQGPVTGKDVYGDPSLKYIGYYDLKSLYPNNLFIEDIIDGRNLGSYFFTFIGSDGIKYNMYDLADSYNIYIQQEGASRKTLQEALKNVKEGGIVKVFTGNEYKDVVINNLQVQPYEVIMPKTMASQLGLTPEDSVDSLLRDQNIFKKKLIKNLAIGITDERAYTVALKRLNGQHFYILSKQQFNKLHPELKKIQTYPPEVDAISGKIYQTDINGERQYELSSLEDDTYTIDGQQVIVTDNVGFYLDAFNYNIPQVSSKVDSVQLGKILRHKSKNKSFRSWINTVGKDITIARHRNQQLSNIEINQEGNFESNGQLVEAQTLNIINYLGNELYTSFKKSLDIIAARIPAQSMQSFMPMKVVGYEDFDINTAYVSTHQIWLQGSDYDIDTVSLLTFELLKNGKFAGWSPYFDLSSEESLRISTGLNYPTGEKIKRINIREAVEHEEGVGDGDKFASYIVNLFSSYDFKMVNNMPTLFERDDTLQNRVELINRLSKDGLLKFSDLSDLGKQKAADIFNKEFSQKFTPEQLEFLFEELAVMVNDHNLYSDNQEEYTKNYVVQQMIDIIANPVNQMQATMSVDQTTDRPKKMAEKSEAGKALKYATPGNVANIMQAIEDNYTGKEVIGISAVGLKSFFAITQYANTLLKQGNLKPLFNKSIVFNGKEYYTIANANPDLAPQTLENLELLQRIANADDAALEISALLSLATDNAKELCLAKLNANSKMADMYIYGLAMGIPYEELGRVLMSPVGDAVASMLKGSIISDKLQLNSIDDVIKFMGNPISSILGSFSTEYLVDNTGKKTGVNISTAIRKSTKGVEKWLNDLMKSLYGELDDFGNYTQKKTINEVINELNSFRNRVITNYSNTVRTDLVQNKQLANKVIDQIIDGLIVYDKVWKNGPQLFENLVTLHKGAAEFNKIGQLLGVNQGVKNKEEDYLNYVRNIENIVPSKLDFIQFMTNQEYRQAKIDEYEKIKVSFNPLAIINTVPHYWGYSLAAFEKHEAYMKSSIKYRTIHDYINVGYQYGTDTKGTIQGISNLCNDKLVNNYLSSLEFVLPAGSTLIYLQDKDTLIKTQTSKDLPIRLGTIGGNATFKNWVEKQVIPDLKAGYNSSSRDRINIALKNNEFINSLRPNIYSKNASRNNSVSYTTTINMSPISEEDRLTLGRLRQSFDSINSSYNGIPIKDILYWYNLISYGGKSGQSTLTSIFDNYVNSAEPSKFREETSKLDTSGDSFQLSNEELATWLTPITSSRRGRFRRRRNKEELRTDLIQILRDEDGVFTGEQIYNNQDNIDYNVILSIPTQGDLIELPFNDGSIIVNTVTRTIMDIKTDKLQGEQLTKVKKFLASHSNLYIDYDPNIRNYKINIDILNKYIDNQINCK